MPQAVRRVQELRNWNRLNNGSCLLEENEICPPVTENLHSTLTAHYKEKVSETQQMQGAQLEKAINSDSSTRLIFQSISAFAQTPAISLRAAARAGTSSSAAAGQQEACLCSSQRSSTSLEENRNIHQTQLAPMTTTIILIDMIEILASGSQLCFWKGRSLQSNTAGAFPKRGMSQTHPEGQQEALTISDEVLGDVERHLDGQRAGQLGAADHGQDAGADRDQGQRCLVHGALHGTCKAHRGASGWPEGKAAPRAFSAEAGEPRHREGRH